jgi:hypothetical protein
MKLVQVIDIHFKVKFQNFLEVLGGEVQTEGRV